MCIWNSYSADLVALRQQLSDTLQELSLEVLVALTITSSVTDNAAYTVPLTRGSIAMVTKEHPEFGLDAKSREGTKVAEMLLVYVARMRVPCGVGDQHRGVDLTYKGCAYV